MMEWIIQMETVVASLPFIEIIIIIISIFLLNPG